MEPPLHFGRQTKCLLIRRSQFEYTVLQPMLWIHAVSLGRTLNQVVSSCCLFNMRSQRAGWHFLWTSPLSVWMAGKKTTNQQKHNWASPFITNQQHTQIEQPEAPSNLCSFLFDWLREADVLIKQSLPMATFASPHPARPTGPPQEEKEESQNKSH